MNFKILFFDLDNTLIDRDRAFSLWLQEFYSQLKGEKLGETDLSSLLEIDRHGMSDRWTFWQAVIDMFDLEFNQEDLQFKLNRELAAFVSPDHAVTSMLSRLAEVYDLQLASNGSSLNQRQKLAAGGCEKYFSKIYISEEVGRTKPLLFESVLKDINCAPEECLMIGDNYEADILGAEEYGFKTCFLGNREADINIAAITELEDALCLLK